MNKTYNKNNTKVEKAMAEMAETASNLHNVEANLAEARKLVQELEYELENARTQYKRACADYEAAQNETVTNSEAVSKQPTQADLDAALNAYLRACSESAEAGHDAWLAYLAIKAKVTNSEAVSKQSKKSTTKADKKGSKKNNKPEKTEEEKKAAHAEQARKALEKARKAKAHKAQARKALEKAREVKAQKAEARKVEAELLLEEAKAKAVSVKTTVTDTSRHIEYFDADHNLLFELTKKIKK